MEYVGGGVDYNSGPYNVQFDVGVTSVLMTVSIHNDNISEDNESFALSTNTSSLPSRVTLSDPSETMVTILANDGKYKMILYVRQTEVLAVAKHVIPNEKMSSRLATCTYATNWIKHYTV